MEESVEDLQNNYEDFEKEFEAFFPDLTAHSEAWIKANVSPSK
jgi:acyl carrier protein phosphodiesterase